MSTKVIEISDKVEFDRRIEMIKNRFINVVDNEGFNWSSISGILKLRVKGNWTVESSNSNYQIPVDALRDFFPILEISPAFEQWRLAVKAFIERDVFKKITGTDIEESWLEGKIKYRHKIQNTYPYLQMTFDNKLMPIKNALRKDDEILFLRKTGEPTYYIFASKVNLFDEEKILIINPENTDRDSTTFELDKATKEHTDIENHNIIYYGAPGTGKSFNADKITNKQNVEKITFHPEYDYHSFVGSYKPHLKVDKIVYGFVPQVFTNIYVKAWTNLEERYYLQIEEVNRGNCAEIFGNFFQLLDRNEKGFSKYDITVDEELRKYLEVQLGSPSHPGIINGKIRLPNNLWIIATMNTSDQSLFPMDSAFKRRWDWEYVPIDYSCTDSDFTIVLENGREYKWLEFLQKVNLKIFETTESQDKQLGNWFINAKYSDNKISQKVFINKVIFYLWNDIFKEEGENSIFVDRELEFIDNDKRIITYDCFFEKVKYKPADLISYILEKELGLNSISPVMEQAEEI